MQLNRRMHLAIGPWVLLWSLTLARCALANTYNVTGTADGSGTVVLYAGDEKRQRSGRVLE